MILKKVADAVAFATFSLGGKEGIRTPEALLTLTRFPGGPLQPLEHLSSSAIEIAKVHYF